MSTEHELRNYWNQWNAKYQEVERLDAPSMRRGAEVLRIVKGLGLTHPDILEVGCGSGWLSRQLYALGPVTAIDIADEVIGRAQARIPEVEFLSGDITTVDLGPRVFDIVVTLETIGNVRDHAGFIQAIGRLLKSGGYLVLTAQNKWVFDRRSDVPPPDPGAIRNWVDIPTVSRLLKQDFSLLKVITVFPAGHGGILRIVNSYKLDSVAARLGLDKPITSIKERLGLGQSIVLLAKRR